MTKYCKYCWKANENPLLKLCRACYYEEQLNNPKQKRFYELKRTPIKKVSNKKKQRLKETWWEKATFEKVWWTRKRNCCICWKYILEPKPFCFAHILAKSKYPYLRNFTNNIALVCSINCHQEIDKRFTKINKAELEQKILNWENII